MSFANPTLTTPQQQTPDAREYKKLQSSIQNLTNNINQIKQHTSFLGTSRDTHSIRTTLSANIESTRLALKTTLDLLNDYTFKQTTNPQIINAQQKIKKEYENVLLAFQSQSKIYAEKQRTIKLTPQTDHHLNNNSNFNDESEDTPLLLSSNQLQLKQLSSKALDSTIQYTEQLIEERDSDLRNIEQSIIEVNEIFRDLGTLVNEQQFQLDNIESNVNEVVVHMEGATGELREANRYHKLASKRCWWIMIVGVCVFLFVVLVVV